MNTAAAMVHETAEAGAPVSSPMPAPRILLLGLGNDILTDDAIGLHVARQLSAELAGHPAIEARETTEMGLALLDFMTGCDAVLLVDAIQTGQAPPGFLHELEPAGLTQLTGRTPHFLGVGETLALGRELGLPMPRRVKILAVEVADPFSLGTVMTPALQAALPAAANRARRLLEELAARR
jgi:hydrogenase maturation protease